jgi:hypothetical protein
VSSSQTPPLGGSAVDPTSVRPEIDDAAIEPVEPAGLRGRLEGLASRGLFAAPRRRRGGLYGHRANPFFAAVSEVAQRDFAAWPQAREAILATHRQQGETILADFHFADVDELRAWIDERGIAISAS